MYSFDFDEQSLTLNITAEGIWSLATLAGFSAMALMRGTALKFRHGRFAVLGDMRRFPVQPSEIATGIELLMGKCEKIIAAPLVMVVGSQLSRMQAERTLKGQWTRVFLDMDEAKAWLAENWAGAGPAGTYHRAA